MELFIYFVALPATIGFTLAILFSVRNYRVYAYRRRVLNEIHNLTMADINSDPLDVDAVRIRRAARYAELNRVSYESMLFKFWKPLDSFYDKGAFDV